MAPKLRKTQPTLFEMEKLEEKNELASEQRVERPHSWSISSRRTVRK
jgi:hypothetical protein